MDILRINTAGSVDDGKSTLIGRLLYETGSITKDKLDALKQASNRKGLDFLDLSLLTDGLIAEREQGITIDVAHIYFSTPRRKYIIADTPGHFEYTRNMITGASTASVSIILMDARKGVVEQTYRHFYIASLLKVPYVIACVNKMDLVNYSKERFQEITDDFIQIAQKLGFKKHQLSFIPVSSLYGENVVVASQTMPWYTAGSLLEVLESLENPVKQRTKWSARFPVQYVVRPKTEEFHDFRGYAGKIAAGSFAKGDQVTVLPSGRTTTIESIHQYTDTLSEAFAGQSVVMALTDDIDLSRGDMIVKPDQAPTLLKDFKARLCWLSAESLQPATYLLQYGTHRLKAKVTAVHHCIDVQTLAITEQVNSLNLNEIGLVSIKTAQPVFLEPYLENPANGAFILIDEFTNNTVAVGFLEKEL